MLSWIIEITISLSLFYLAYILFLRNVPFFKANRYYLLAAVFFSLIMPYISFTPPVNIVNYSYLIPEVTISGGSDTDLSQVKDSGWVISKGLMIIYILVAVLLGGRLAMRLIQLLMLAARNKTRKYKNAHIVSLESDQAPFSFLNYIFINETLYGEEEARNIIEHEMVHINQYHTFDLILLELLTIIQWFNPVAWLYRKAMLEIHEYLADEEILKRGTDISFYQSLILNLQLGREFLSPASNFNKSLTLNRLKMMTTIKPASWKRIRFFLLLPALTLLALMCTKTAYEQAEISDSYKAVSPVAAERLPDGSLRNKPAGIHDEDLDKEIFFIVENMPDFQGGGQSAFRHFIANNLTYPEIAKENGIEGRVFVQFVVRADGSISDAKIARGIDPSLDEEALRVVNSSPVWTPGRQRGQNVAVAFTFPINFVLQSEDKE